MSRTAVPAALRRAVEEDGRDRCGDCLTQRTVIGQPMTVEHLVPLFNPRTQVWHNHFVWSDDKTHIIGITRQGRATVVALKLNNQDIVAARSLWVQAGWHPPLDG